MTDQQIEGQRPVGPDADLFAERAAPPALKHVFGILGLVAVCVTIIAITAYFIASGTD